MKGFNILVLLFYSLVIFIVAVGLMALFLDVLTFDKIIYYYQLHNLKPLIGITGAVLIIISLLVLRITFSGVSGQRSLRFKTADGLVTVSLSAIENLTRHLLGQIPDIKDMRPRIFPNRKGIEVLIKARLYTNASIPEVTEKIQHYIKTRLQETLGPEKNISIKIQIERIEQAENKP